MTAADPFTRASPQYIAAMAQPHKSGPGLEIYQRRGPSWRSWALLILGGAVFWLALAGVAVFVWSL